MTSPRPGQTYKSAAGNLFHVEAIDGDKVTVIRLGWVTEEGEKIALDHRDSFCFSIDTLTLPHWHVYEEAQHAEA